MTGKYVGRIGDTPQIGNGTYADDNIGGVSTTGLNNLDYTQFYIVNQPIYSGILHLLSIVMMMVQSVGITKVGIRF